MGAISAAKAGQGVTIYTTMNQWKANEPPSTRPLVLHKESDAPLGLREEQINSQQQFDIIFYIV